MSKNFELLQRAERDRRIPARYTGEQFGATHLRMPAHSDASTKGIPRDLSVEIGKLVQNVFFAPPAFHQSVVFSAAQEERQPNLVAACAAELMVGQFKRSVCVIDANPASPSLSAHFGVANTVGFIDALRGTGSIMEFAHRIPDAELAIVASGMLTRDWESLLLSEAVHMRLRECRSAYDFVLVVAPPLSTSHAAVRLAQAADGLVMVLRAQETRRERALKSKQDVENANVKLLGAVLDNHGAPVPRGFRDFINSLHSA